MSTHTLLADATSQLAAAGVPSPRHDVEQLLCHVLRVDRFELGQAEPSASHILAFCSLVARRAKREPLQYILGRVGFRHVELSVGPGAFIPRPETEVLAGWALDALAARRAESGPRPVAVDLCTGCGTIAVAIADEAPWATVHAVELSEEALVYAEANLLGRGVDVRQGDIATAFPELDGRVDVVVANPPYIPLEAWESVDVEARTHDPGLALWSGIDGLDATRMVEQTAARLLAPGGRVGTEHADVQASSVPAIFAGAGRWRDVLDHVDLAGRPRFTTARRS